MSGIHVKCGREHDDSLSCPGYPTHTNYAHTGFCMTCNSYPYICTTALPFQGIQVGFSQVVCHQPYTCPNCDRYGNQNKQPYGFNPTAIECRSCKGTGVVWS